MKRPLLLIPLLIAASLLPVARASISHSFAASLDGAQEVPPVATSGRGFFAAVLNDAQTQLTFTLTVSGLDLSKIIASHIHVGPVGKNGPIILFLFDRGQEGTFTGFKTGVLTSANLLPKPLQGVSNFADAVAKMLAGETYVNVHTEAYPGGEIRGQIGKGINIDIKPGSDPNSINVRTAGVIPVALLTTPSFDGASVDPSTVRFGRTGSEAAPAIVPPSLEDVDGDGDLDRVLHFRFADTGIQAGDGLATVTGSTFTGSFFAGSDAIRAFFPGDVNGDLRVNIIDLALVAAAYGSRAGYPGWDWRADFNEDSTINILDLAITGVNYGQKA